MVCVTTLTRTRWLTHTRMCTERGGPIFWIHENHVCPDCNRGVFNSNACCQNVPAGQFCQADRAGPEEEDTGINGGCERFRFISGADEIALNAEMGLYRSYFQAPWDLPKFTVFIIAGSLKSQTG